uniref:Uncharacterized protein n=1 Tax=Anguilla anguilla TaxID=7936 RepID=A0A0E9SV66_ANGAN
MCVIGIVAPPISHGFFTKGQIRTRSIILSDHV